MATTPSRRTFLKGTGAVGAAMFVSQYTPDVGWLSVDPDAPDGVDDAVDYTEEWIPTTCWIGKQDCGILARVVDGRIVKLEGNPAHPRNRGTLCPKGIAQIQAVYDPNRVKTPLIRTNAKGETGEWRQATWDEALTLVARKMNEVRAVSPSKVLWQKGRSKAKDFYDDAFVKASGATKLHHGAFCSDAGYRAAEYTTGLHGVLHPDFRETKYLLSLGWNMMSGGGNKFCQLTWHQQMIEARERGLKIVHVDPSRRGAGPFADEWLPIKPATDVAFLLAIMHELLNNPDLGYDAEYLSLYTDGPFLLNADGTFLKINGKEVVYDEASRGVVAYDTEGARPSLSGTFAFQNAETRNLLRASTAFDALTEHVAGKTPEWAEAICDIPADKIRQVAAEMFEAARIGSTTEMDGIELPYRPVAIMGYHVAQQELGFQLVRAALMVEMLLGAVEAVGGQRSDFTYKVHKNYEPFGELETTVADGPYNAMIIHMANPLLSFADQPVMMAALEKLKFIAVIDPWLSETADLYGDVVLPAATIEKYEGPMSATDQYVDAVAMRVPPMDPLFDSKGDIDIYLALCAKAGILNGEGGYLDHVNRELKLSDEFKLDIEAATVPEVRDIFDRWAKTNDIAGGIEFFEQGVGIQPKGLVAASKYYGRAMDPPFAGIKHRLYGSSLLATQRLMRDRGVDEIFWRLYTPLPDWVQPTMDRSPAEFDFYLLSRKMIEFKQSRSTFIPLLNELAPEQFLEINPGAARERDIEDGDMVRVTSQNAVTGETRAVDVRARFLESLRPDTVVMPHHFGFFTNPITKGQGPTANVLFFSGEGYVSNTADQSFQVKVRVEKA
jgi:anaerobic selenocysteine-containing dehydrogenase